MNFPLRHFCWWTEASSQISVRSLLLVGLGPLGVLDEGELILRREMPPSPPVIRPNALATPIDIIFAAAGSDARLLDASRVEARGVVLAAMGRGNVPPAMVPGIQRWVADGKPVVITSRSRNVAHRLTGRTRDILDVAPTMTTRYA